MRKLIFILFFALVLDFAQAQELKVLTYNLFLVDAPALIEKELTPDISKRIKLIPQAVAATGADIIALQEVWHPKRRNVLIEEFRKLGYTSFEFSTKSEAKSTFGIRNFGDGLLIVSRYPTKSELANPDSTVNELSFSDFTRMDESVINKGAIHVKVEVPSLGWIDLVNTHLGAVSFLPEAGRFDPDHSATKEAQANELVDFVTPIAKEASVLIVAGDLNTHYLDYASNGRIQISESDPRAPMLKAPLGGYTSESSWPYKMMTEIAGLELVDTFLDYTSQQIQQSRSSGSSTFLRFEEFASEGITFSRFNPYVSSGYFSTEPSGRIDYIFMKPSSKIKVSKSEILFKDWKDTSGMNLPALSDHYGVMTTFQIQ